MKQNLKLLFLLIPFLGLAQHYDNWNAYFSYNNIVAMDYANGKLVAAAENSIFIYDENTGDFITKSTLDGLSGDEITAIHYSETYQKTIIAYQSGLLEILDDDDDVPVLKVVDIINKTNIPANNKSVNHIKEFNGLLYLSCDYGISVYNIANLVFGDTYYIGTNGAQIKINATEIYNGNIYAGTANDGVLKANLANPYLIDYANWQTVQGGTWRGFSVFNNELYAIAYSSLFKYNGSVFAQNITYSSGVKSITASAGNLTVSLIDKTFVYDTNLTEIQQQSYTTDYDDFSIKTSYYTPQGLYMATNKYGLLKSTQNNASALEEIHPDGPLMNTIFGVDAMQGELWTAFGDYTVYYNAYPLRSRGVSHYNRETATWINHKYDDFQLRNLVKPTINPDNTNEVYISSFKDGLLKITDDTVFSVYNTTNSSQQDIAPIPLEIRNGTNNFDANGKLWMTNSLVENAIHSYDTATDSWENFSVADIIPDGIHADYCNILIDNNGVKWLGTPYHGVIGYDTAGNRIKNIVEGANGGLPNVDVRSIAIDHNNRLWIGTQTGLVVLNDLEGFFDNPDPQAAPIVILDDGIPKLLLDQQWISDIAVDGNNNKWFATQDAGVFYTSENGKEVLYHFTVDNSPLPTNSVDDIAIDASTGEVFFATSKGLVSFNGTATEPAPNLDNAYVFPNPVRPNYTGLVTIKNLIKDANVKITDVTGNLVYEAVSEGGTLQWDLTAFGTHRVASGVYLVHIISADATATKLLKLMVIN